MTTFVWTVSRMDSIADAYGKTDVVATVSWTCTGTQTIDGIPYSASVSEETVIEYLPWDTWVEYPNLTPAIVFDWCWEHGDVNKAAVELRVQGLIDTLPKPPLETKPLPW